jgi:branched-chain amino acid transport system substrate-binding protein
MKKEAIVESTRLRLRTHWVPKPGQAQTRAPAPWSAALCAALRRVFSKPSCSLPVGSRADPKSAAKRRTPKPSGSARCVERGMVMLTLAAILGSAQPGWCAYEDKPDKNPNAAPEPVLQPGTPSVFQVGPGEYPYYGNAPADMLPYRNLEPYYRYWLTRLPFRGPGRDYAVSTNLTSLKVGLLSPPPYGPEARRGEMSRKGVMLAFEEANAARAGQLPFEVIEKADSPQWGSAANIAVEFADKDVLGFIGTIDGDATHVALRVALKIETFMVNCSDPDPTLTETQIPWLIRIFPDNRQQGYRLASLIVKERGLKKIVVLRANNRPGRVGVRPFVDAVRRLGFPILQEINFKDGDRKFDTQVAVIKQAEPEAVVFWGNPSETAVAAVQLRAAGVKGAFFGFDRLLDPEFVKLAGSAAEGATATYFFDPEKKDRAWTSFRQRFQARYGLEPEIYAGYGYDAGRIMIDAINHAGPNKYRVHDQLAGLDEYTGVTGRMRFDGRWDNIAPVVVAHCRRGRWQFDSGPAQAASLK